MSGSLLRPAAHHESIRKIDSTFVLFLLQGSNQFSAIIEPAVARIKLCTGRDQPESPDFAMHQICFAHIAHYLSVHPQAGSA
jgi:hypothetical protein